MSIRNVTTGETLATALLTYDPAAAGNGPIAPGGSRPRQFSFTMPDLARGTGQIVFTVTTDVDNTIFESNAGGTAETNNTSSITQTSTLAPYPDLRVANLAVDPATGLQSGSGVVVHWEDTNTGSRATGGSWHDRVTVQNATTGEILVTATLLYDATAVGNGPIAPGGSRARQYSLTLPDGVRGAGPIKFTVSTDVSDEVAESNTAGDAEANNAGLAHGRRGPRQLSRPPGGQPADQPGVRPALGDLGGDPLG